MDLNDSSIEDTDMQDDIMNYKGYFIENEGADEEPKYFEFGAHFPYKELCKCLEILRKEQIQKEAEKGETEIKQLVEINKKKIENRERNNTRNKDIKDNFQNILNGFNTKIRTRNIGNQEQNEDKNELTYIPFNHNINNLSIKKEEKNPHKSIFINKINYTRIYFDNKNKKLKNINNDILNKKENVKNKNDSNNNNIISNNNNNHNFINKKFNKNKLNNINKLSDKCIMTRNREEKKIYQQINIPINNKTLPQNQNYNKNINSMNHFKSYQIQKKSQNNKKNIYIKKFNLNDSSFNYTSKENIKNKNNTINKNHSQYTEPKFSYNYINKNFYSKSKKIKLDKIMDNASSFMNLRNKNGKLTTSNFDFLLNSYSTIKKVSPDKIIKNIPIGVNFYTYYKQNNILGNKKNIQSISLKKYKFNEHHNTDYKGIISVSMDNKRHLSNNMLMEKLNKNKKIINNDITHFSYINKKIRNNHIFPDFLNNNNLRKNDLSNSNNYLNVKLNDSKNKNKKEEPINYNKINININSNNNTNNNIFNLLDKNEKISRNKNNNYFLNNISSINYSNNKIIRSMNSNMNNSNNNNNIFKVMNMTQQNNKYVQNKNQNNQIKNKIINFNKSLINDNKKKILIEIPSMPDKKINTTSNNDNPFCHNKNNNNYKSKFINQKNQNNKTNYSLLNNFLNNKSKKSLNLEKDILYKSKLKEKHLSKNKNIENSFVNNNDNSINKNNISKNYNQLNSNPYMAKKFENLINKKSPKKNININININNNNKIFYNKIDENKSPILKVNQKIIKSPNLQKIRSYMNRSTYGNTNSNLIINNKGKKSFGKLNNNNNNLKNIHEKIKIQNIQFPKAKLLNIYNQNNNI